MQLADAESLTLGKAYEKALLNEGRVKGYAYRAQASKEVNRQARSKLLPVLSATVTAGERKYEPRYSDDARKETTSDFNARLTQPLYHPEYLSEWKRTRHISKGSELQYAKERLRLGKEVAEAYFEVIRSQKNVELSQSHMEANQAKYQQIERTHSFGLSSRVDLLEAKVNFDESRIELIREKKHLDVSRISLSRLMGEEVLSLPGDVIDPWDLEKVFKDDYAHWRERLDKNIDLRIARQNMTIARQDLETRKYGHYPKVDAKLTYIKTDSTDIYTNRSDARADIEINIPLFQGWYVQSHIDEAKLILQSAHQEIAYSRRIADLLFEEEWEKYMAAYESVKMLREAVESAELYMLSVEKSYEKGLKSLFDFYDAKAKLFQVRRDLVNTVFDIAVAYAGLLEVTGELSVERYEELDTMLYRTADAASN